MVGADIFNFFFVCLWSNSIFCGQSCFTPRPGPSIQWLATYRPSDFQGFVQRSAPVTVSLTFWGVYQKSFLRRNTHLLLFFVVLTVKADVKLKVGITLKGCPADQNFKARSGLEKCWTSTCMALLGRRGGFCQGFVGVRVRALVPPSDSEPWVSVQGRLLLQEPPWWAGSPAGPARRCQALRPRPPHLLAAKHRGAEQPVAVPCNEKWI